VFSRPLITSISRRIFTCDEIGPHQALKGSFYSLTSACRASSSGQRPPRGPAGFGDPRRFPLLLVSHCRWLVPPHSERGTRPNCTAVISLENMRAQELSDMGLSLPDCYGGPSCPTDASLQLKSPTTRNPQRMYVPPCAKNNWDNQDTGTSLIDHITYDGPVASSDWDALGRSFFFR
jgi:hypothetical protein